MCWEGVSDGLKVIVGSVIQCDDLVQYMIIDDVISFGGVLCVLIVCLSVGVVGNVDDGMVLILVMLVNGLLFFGVVDILIGGFDIEELEMWCVCVIEWYYWMLQGGVDGDYVVWVKEVFGIICVWIYCYLMGMGIVGVMIVSSDLINFILEELMEMVVR